MPIPQQKFREIVFQLIYSGDFAGSTDEEMTSFMMQQFAVTKKVVREAIERQKLVEAKRDDLDLQIKNASVAYDFDRITRIERNILRLSLYELLFDQTIPPKVVIAEGIRLARKFASPEGANFVNAILDSIYKKGVDVIPAG